MSDHDKLIIRVDNQLFHEAVLAKNDILIGRSADCDVVLELPQVSRRHARLYRGGGGWMLENLSQSAPVRLRGAPIDGPVMLLDGDQFQLGPLVAQLCAAQPAPAAPVQPVPAAPAQPAPAATMMMPAARLPAAGTALGAPSLMVLYGETSVEHPLLGPTITIGRSADNTIVIPVSTVSRHHAVLQQTPQGYTIVDQQSTNGLLYNGSRVAEHQLAHGDVLRISDELGNFVTLTYHDPQRAAAPAPPQALQLGADRSTMTIGRAADNTLVLNQPDVSAHHARIRWEGGSAVLEDLGSTNGTYVRGERVTRRVIQPGDVLQIASCQLVYTADAIATVDAERVQLDAIQLYSSINKDTQVLLRHVSLSIAPRELVALVGGSGAGKSTLMDALSGVRPAMAGQVRLNGDDYYRNVAAYRRSLGYVPQDDIIHPDLTVERTLHYAARLRLPPDMSPAEIERRITEVLDEVQLSQVRGVEVSRLSGGQRKRVSIAVELLSGPRLFFLDEPTTGLDPGLDKRMMTLLRRLADQGRTIILVTHATANITACDKVAFLARGGRLCFYGPPHEALAFFEARSFSEIYARLEVSPSSGEEWQARFEQSPAYQRYIADRLSSAAPANGRAAGPAQVARPPRASLWRQGVLLTQRYFERVTRERTGLFTTLLQAPLIGALLALFAPAGLFADGTSPADVQRVLFLLVIAAILIGANSATREIVKELPIYLRERLVNLRVAPYVVSKALVLGLLALVQSLLLVGVVLARTGLPPDGVLLPGAIELLLGAWLAALGGMAMGLLISALASTAEQAVSFLPLVMLVQIVLAGLIFPLRGPLAPISYITVSKWSMDALGTTADLNRMYYLALPSGPPGIRPLALPQEIDGFAPENYDAVTGTRAGYTREDHQASRRAHLLSRWATLAAIITGLLVLTGLLLGRQERQRQRR